MDSNIDITNIFSRSYKPLLSFSLHIVSTRPMQKENVNINNNQIMTNYSPRTFL